MIDCERCWTILQQMQCKTSTNVLWFGECLSSTLEASVFMEKNYSDNLNSINNRGKDLTWKQMFEISEQLTLEQSDEIFGLSQISWENSSWKPLIILGQWCRGHQSLACTGLCIFRFCVMSWKGESEPSIKYCLWKNSWVGSKIHHNTELWTQLTESRWNSSGIFSQNSPLCSSSKKSKSSWTKWANLLNNFCISCVDELLTGWSPDRATHGLPTVGHRCTVGVLAGTHRCDDSSRQDDESPKRQPYSAALHWAKAGLHWLHSWRVHLQHYQTWPMLCTQHTTQENQTKLRRDLTWLAWLEHSIELDRTRTIPRTN